jgi:zinc protease
MTVRARSVLGFLLCVLTGCAGGGVQAPAIQGGGAKASGDVTPTREVLSNGVVLVTQEHRAAGVVAMQLWLRVGGRDEAPNELGLSHYLEHMLFKGTPTRPPGAIDRLIEGLGGTSNAFTAYDFTHFDVVLPVAHMRAGLDLLADIAVNASFEPDELESEKKVVFEEMNLTQDDPERFLTRRLSEVAFRPHPYGRPILGTRELIQALTRDGLVAYYRKRYVPSNMVVVVVGPVTQTAVRPMVDAAFGRLRGPSIARASLPPVPTLGPTSREDVSRPEQQAYLGLGWMAPPTGHADIFAVDLLSYILGDGPSSRLNQTVREQDGLVEAIEATYVPREKAGLVMVTARTEPGKLDAAERSVLGVLGRIRDQGVTEEERQRALVTAEASYAFDIETAEGLARSYGQAETTWTVEDEVRYLERLRKVTAAEIQAAANKYLADGNYTRVRFVPGGGR